MLKSRSQDELVAGAGNIWSAIVDNSERTLRFDSQKLKTSTGSCIDPSNSKYFSNKLKCQIINLIIDFNKPNWRAFIIFTDQTLIWKSIKHTRLTHSKLNCLLYRKTVYPNFDLFFSSVKKVIWKQCTQFWIKNGCSRKYWHKIRRSWIDWIGKTSAKFLRKYHWQIIKLIERIWWLK